MIKLALNAGRKQRIPAATDRSGMIGGSQQSNAPATGRGHTDPIVSAQPDVPNTIVKQTSPQSTVQPGATAPRKSMTGKVKLASLPPPASLGALLGLLFGHVLDQQGTMGSTRDAAIGAAAYASAEQDLDMRLRALHNAGSAPVFGAMPISPTPIRRPGSLTL